jgi:polysaccharide export outer membrane protein
MSAQALENAIRSRLSGKYTADLDVTVSLVSLGRTAATDVLYPRIFVTGEVTRPGPYDIRARTNVLQAIALAGGLGPFAAGRRVQVRRQVGGMESIFTFDYRAFEAGLDVEGNIDLRPGDVVIVPERGLFELQ